jgi:valyl-tRNA synthetase
VFIQVQSDQEIKLFESQAPTIVTLVKGCKSVKVVKDISDVPAGCGSEILTPTVVIHALVRVSTHPLPRSPPLKLLQGLIDFDLEIAKCEKKLTLARLNLEKTLKVESQPDYEETVPENVRLVNEDKVRSSFRPPYHS